MKKRTSFLLVLCILLSVFLSACVSSETAEPSVMTEASDPVSMTFGETWSKAVRAGFSPANANMLSRP